MKRLIWFMLLVSSFAYASVSVEVPVQDPWHGIRAYMNHHAYFTQEDQFALLERLRSMKKDEHEEFKVLSRVAREAASEASSSSSSSHPEISPVTLNEILLLNIKQVHAANMASIKIKSDRQEAHARLSLRKLYVTGALALVASLVSLGEMVYIVHN